MFLKVFAVIKLQQRMFNIYVAYIFSLKKHVVLEYFNTASDAVKRHTFS